MRAVVEENPPFSTLQVRGSYRLIPSRYPSVGILDRIAAPEDLEAVIELESWTNDRISTELGILHRVPKEEWTTGKPMSSVIMAAFCHPRPGGGRFNDGERGAWYAGCTLDIAHAEVIYHRTAELAEIGVWDTYVQERAYLADFRGSFADLRNGFGDCHSPDSYVASQKLAAMLLAEGANGVVYRSVRHLGGECICCFRPRLVSNVRQGGHYEYRWNGSPVPSIRKLTAR
jgi:hypothetical protein